MALETWLTKLKSAISSGIQETMHRKKSSSVGILAFEITTLMSKLLHLWRSLSDANISRLRQEIITLQGVRKVVSDDDAFLLGLACAELTETLRLVADSTANLSKRCSDDELRGFDRVFKIYTDSGEDLNRWVMSWKEMEVKAKKLDRYIASTAVLHKEMDELAEAEQGLKKLIKSSKITTVAEAQQKIFWQRQEVKYLKQSSLWGCSFDRAVSLLARSSFTILARIKHVFGINYQEPVTRNPSVVYPSSDSPNFANFCSSRSSSKHSYGLFELSSSLITPPATTLGGAALAMHYANIISVTEKMIRAPRAVGPDARDDLYEMLPVSVRGILRSRLKGVGWGATRDATLASEWREALDRILDWLGPVARDTIRWQGERSFERRTTVMTRGNVLMLQTLYFANRDKVEAAVAEMLVGLNYVWRFEVEMGCMLD